MSWIDGQAGQGAEAPGVAESVDGTVLGGDPVSLPVWGPGDRRDRRRGARRCPELMSSTEYVDSAVGCYQPVPPTCRGGGDADDAVRMDAYAGEGPQERDCAEGKDTPVPPQEKIPPVCVGCHDAGDGLGWGDVESGKRTEERRCTERKDAAVGSDQEVAP